VTKSQSLRLLVHPSVEDTSQASKVGSAEESQDSRFDLYTNIPQRIEGSQIGSVLNTAKRLEPTPLTLKGKMIENIANERQELPDEQKFHRSRDCRVRNASSQLIRVTIFCQESI
jgi:hypothetical protein